mmetsp:Transcript_66026/g.178494  ORF Transcript_66026/g.178494 Transcript_66026/m.178494 type:complete len:253 (-) Transcript_66026:72-830(-)
MKSPWKNTHRWVWLSTRSRNGRGLPLKRSICRTEAPPHRLSRRLAARARSLRRSSGNCSRASFSCNLCSTCTKHVSSAVTVAVRVGESPRAPTSPARSPRPRISTLTPPELTAALPWWSRASQSPSSPSRINASPSMKRRSSVGSPSASANSGQQSSKNRHRDLILPPMHFSWDTLCRVAARELKRARSSGNSAMMSSNSLLERIRTSHRERATTVAVRFRTRPSTAISPKHWPPLRVPTFRPRECASMQPL